MSYSEKLSQDEAGGKKEGKLLTTEPHIKQKLIGEPGGTEKMDVPRATSGTGREMEQEWRCRALLMAAWKNEHCTDHACVGLTQPGRINETSGRRSLKTKLVPMGEVLQGLGEESQVATK